MFSVGFGLVDIVKDNHPNLPVITTIIMLLAGSAVLIIGTEKLQKKLRGKENETQHSSSFEPPVLVPTSETSVADKESGVVLTGTLKTELAEKVYAKAIEAGFMKEQGTYYKWNESKVLLAYMCGRIYCGDKPEQSKFDEKPFWKFGRQGVFPDTELNHLFQLSDLGQSRSNRKDLAVPTKSNEIDKFFE